MVLYVSLIHTTHVQHTPTHSSSSPSRCDVAMTAIEYLIGQKSWSSIVALSVVTVRLDSRLFLHLSHCGLVLPPVVGHIPPMANLYICGSSSCVYCGRMIYLLTRTFQILFRPFCWRLQALFL